MFSYRNTDVYRDTLNSEERGLLIDKAIKMSEDNDFPKKFKEVIMDLIGVIKKGSMPLKLMSLAAIAYLINPIDLIPDFIPMMGFADDMFVLGALLVKIREAIG